VSHKLHPTISKLNQKKMVLKAIKRVTTTIFKESDYEIYIISFNDHQPIKLKLLSYM